MVADKEGCFVFTESDYFEKVLAALESNFKKWTIS